MGTTRWRLLLGALVCLVGAGDAGQAATQGPRLRYLRHLVESGRLAPPERLAVTLLVGPGFDARRALPAGVSLRRDGNGEVLRTAHVVPVLASLASLDGLATLPGVERVETEWFPRSPPPPLDISRPELEVPQVWVERDHQGLPLTGAGVVIADLDTGVDVFHPHFFHADGGSFPWIDVDASGFFSPGVDAVDRNRNGQADAGETLMVLETGGFSGYPQPNPPGYNVDIDWLYADANRNGTRDYGPSWGYTDQTPSFGEPLYHLDDTNRNGVVDPGEPLIALKTSKIRAVRERSGRVRQRGFDLIDAERDFAPHGTYVAGILAGGVAGLSRMAGMAPDAELLFANMSYPSVPPFEDDMTVLALWARSEGARVMVYESGNWIWAYLDGSSASEVTLSDLAAEGFLQLTPTGNLAGGRQQQAKLLSSGQQGVVSATTPAARGVTDLWPSLLWRGSPGEVSISLLLPGGSTLNPCLCGTSERAGPYDVYSDRTQSPRGTSMANFEIRLAAGGEISGTWTFRLTPARDLEVLAYSWDDRSGWSGVTTWDQADDRYTVTQPATADRSIAVGAYSPRSCTRCDPVGEINSFSGRGKRVDGVSVLDLTTPGSDVYSTSPFGTISRFGGTSSALPHAAGAAALLVQLNPNDPHDVIEALLRQTALADGFTGPVPNDTWGMGKLRLRGAWEIARRPSLLRDDSITSLRPLAPGRGAIFPATGPTTLRIGGPWGYSKAGEGPTLDAPGSTDGDAFLAFHVDPGPLVDPEGAFVIGDDTRPLIFYELTGNSRLLIRKTPGGLELSY